MSNQSVRVQIPIQKVVKLEDGKFALICNSTKYNAGKNGSSSAAVVKTAKQMDRIIEESGAVNLIMFRMLLNLPGTCMLEADAVETHAGDEWEAPDGSRRITKNDGYRLINETVKLSDIAAMTLFKEVTPAIIDASLKEAKQESAQMVTATVVSAPVEELVDDTVEEVGQPTETTTTETNKNNEEQVVL